MAGRAGPGRIHLSLCFNSLQFVFTADGGWTQLRIFLIVLPFTRERSPDPVYTGLKVKAYTLETYDANRKEPKLFKLLLKNISSNDSV